MFRRDDLGASEVVPAERRALRQGEVTLAVERLAVTANTLTYGKLRDCPIPFLDVFPAPAGYGRVPTWGFAVVEESRHPDVVVGSRYFGYLPMSTHHTTMLEPIDRGLVDVSPERSFLHPWYRTFQPVGPEDELDDRRALLWPLFPASFNLTIFLAKQAALGARSVVVSSASSKTAIGLAVGLSEQSELTTLGLTSAPHTAFVAGLRRYDLVASYDSLSSVSVSVPGPVVFVDFTGEAKRLASVYQHFAGKLSYTALVGYTDPGAVVSHPQLSDPKPVVFFTPVVEAQVASDEGADRYYARYHQAEQQFVESSASWLTVEHRRGPDALARAFDELLTGAPTPERGSVVSP
jgi:hypothetical protein